MKIKLILVPIFFCSLSIISRATAPQRDLKKTILNQLKIGSHLIEIGIGIRMGILHPFQCKETHTLIPHGANTIAGTALIANGLRGLKKELTRGYKKTFVETPKSVVQN